MNKFRKQFQKENDCSFDCNGCKSNYICCPEENDCLIEKKYINWLERKLEKSEKINEEEDFDVEKWIF